MESREGPETHYRWFIDTLSQYSALKKTVSQILGNNITYFVFEPNRKCYPTSVERSQNRSGNKALKMNVSTYMENVGTRETLELKYHDVFVLQVRKQRLVNMK